ncbi:hypothetical protein [Leifsonia naganoensis]|uniref:Nucleoside 2-deoxyribosyltransferase n=1 Tax=Leifsonia naganoensis TaxID=150025 RepID=A0A853DN57_9MICO|nr:hypothetical protein [Leifsonia naganoensis]NYK08939.1 nucleoside 2-deoxyribosyltransferase [Leifsonia naganoensis]
MTANTIALKAVISGSYRRHFAEMLALKAALEAERVSVLAPVSETIINPTDEFVLLDLDPTTDPRTLQDSIFAMIRHSTFIVVANIDGYLGAAATMEIGYAIAQGVQVLTQEPVSDPNLAGYTRPIHEVFPLLPTRYSATLAGFKENHEAVA